MLGSGVVLQHRDAGRKWGSPPQPGSVLHSCPIELGPTEHRETGYEHKWTLRGQHIRVWGSLVAYSAWTGDVGGSNPPTLTIRTKAWQIVTPLGRERAQVQFLPF